MNCPKCGADNQRQNMFCGKCGADLLGKAPSSVPYTAESSQPQKQELQSLAQLRESRNLLISVLLIAIFLVSCVFVALKGLSRYQNQVQSQDTAATTTHLPTNPQQSMEAIRTFAEQESSEMKLIKTVSMAPDSEIINFHVTEIWGMANTEQRMMFAKKFQEVWASACPYKNPTQCFIRIVDTHGDGVGGSQPDDATKIWVN